MPTKQPFRGACVGVMGAQLPLDSLCVAAACASGPGQSETSGAPPAAAVKVASREVEAFCSVHDLIQAAIAHYGSRATLREIYRFCEMRGVIAYKRTQGWRYITDKQHWKSQIRHALYTSGRFSRCTDDPDYWSVASPYAHAEPQTTGLLVPTGSADGSSAEASSSQWLQPAATPRSSSCCAGAGSGLGSSADLAGDKDAAAASTEAAAALLGAPLPAVRHKRSRTPRMRPAPLPRWQWSSTNIAAAATAAARVSAPCEDTSGSAAGSAQGTPRGSSGAPHLLASSLSDLDDDCSTEGSAGSISGMGSVAGAGALLQATSLAWHRQDAASLDWQAFMSPASGAAPLSGSSPAAARLLRGMLGMQQSLACVGGAVPELGGSHPLLALDQRTAAPGSGGKEASSHALEGKRQAPEEMPAPCSPPAKLLRAPTIAPATPRLHAWPHTDAQLPALQPLSPASRRSRRKASVVHRSVADSELHGRPAAAAEASGRWKVNRLGTDSAACASAACGGSNDAARGSPHTPRAAAADAWCMLTPPTPRAAAATESYHMCC